MAPRFLIIGKSSSFTTKQLLKTLRYKKYPAVTVSSRELTVTMKGGNFFVCAKNEDILNFDLVIFQGYTDLYSEISIIAQHLTANGMFFIDSSMHPLMRNKLYQANLFHANNLPHPPIYKTRGLEMWKKFLSSNEFPIVFKSLRTNEYSRGLGVHKFSSYKEALQFLEESDNADCHIAQKYIPIQHDYRLIVLGDTVLGCIQRSLSQDGFRTNASQGGACVPFSATNKMKDLAIQTSHSLGCTFSGIDLITDGLNWFVLEVNTGPQWQGFEGATQINVAEKLIEYTAKKYNELQTHA